MPASKSLASSTKSEWETVICQSGSKGYKTSAVNVAPGGPEMVRPLSCPLPLFTYSVALNHCSLCVPWDGQWIGVGSGWYSLLASDHVFPYFGQDSKWLRDVLETIPLTLNLGGIREMTSAVAPPLAWTLCEGGSFVLLTTDPWHLTWSWRKGRDWQVFAEYSPPTPPAKLFCL